MRIYREKDYDAMSRRAATIIAAQIVAKPDCVLGLATGSSPVGTYKNLVAWNKQGDISFKEVRSVNLDEYYGLSGDHDQSYRYFMQTNLFDHVDIVPENTNVPNGLAQDPAAEGATRPWWPPWATPTSSCWAWAATATSASTSPAASSP